jgi:hypothetical protein
MAVGASRHEILLQFLRAVLVSLAGGVIESRSAWGFRSA